MVQHQNIEGPTRLSQQAHLLPRLGSIVLLWCVVIVGLVQMNGCTDAPTAPFSYSNPRDAQSFDADPFVTDWMDLCCRSAQQTPQFSDAIASRAYAYISIALYESLRQGFADTSQSLSATLNDTPVFPQADVRSKRYHWLIVANTAVAKVALHMYRMAPAPVLARIQEREAGIYADISARFPDMQSLRNSVDFGGRLADAVIEYSAADGAGNSVLNPFDEEFVPTADSSCWQPEPSDPKAHLAQWGSLRPFVVRKDEMQSELNPGTFPAFSTKPTSAFFTSALTSYNNFTSSQPDDRDLVAFWGNEAQSENAISTHMMSIATQLLRAKPNSIRFAAEFLAKLSLGMADACIAGYKTKYRYPLMRPTVYIARYVNPSWKTDSAIEKLFVPPCPEYCSVLMAVSEHACSVFSSYFGANVSMTDRSRENNLRVVRDYFTFNQVLAEVRGAQLHSGLQFPFSVDAGSKLGKGVASVYARRLRF